MSISTAQEKLLTRAYSLVRQSGLLSTSAGSRCFKSAYFLYKHYVEDNLEALLRRHPGLLRGGNVLDIGANVGYTATVLARDADTGRKVYAFEPEPLNYALLQRSASHGALKNRIVPLQCAVGAADGTIDLWLNERHPADHRIITDEFRSRHPGASGATVPLVSIDKFLEVNPVPVAFVKIDVQGYELPVCQGMKNTLENNPELTVVLEYMPSAMRELGFDPAHLTSFWMERGFQAYLVGSGGKLSAGVPSVLEESGYADLLFSRRPIVLSGGE